MEIAIPLVALGAMYIISNQKKEKEEKTGKPKTNEGFASRTRASNKLLKKKLSS